MEYVARTLEDTESFSIQLIEKIKEEVKRKNGNSIFLTFSGDLGSGKTTLTKYIAKHLGAEDVVTSPTFILRNDYKLKDDIFKKLIHIDAYRFEEESEGKILELDDLAKKENALIILEWPERVTNLLPKDRIDLIAKVKDNEYTFNL